MVAAKQRLLTGLVVVINFFNIVYIQCNYQYAFPVLLRRRICPTMKMFLVGDHFLYSHDRYVSCSHDAVRRNNMLVSAGNFNGQEG